MPEWNKSAKAAVTLPTRGCASWEWGHHSLTKRTSFTFTFSLLLFFTLCFFVLCLLSLSLLSCLRMQGAAYDAFYAMGVKKIKSATGRNRSSF